MNEILTPVSKLTLSRYFDAPPDEVFDAWVGPEFAEWLGPAEIKSKMIAMDARQGGSFQLEATQPDGRIIEITGTYLEYDPPHRLTFTFAGGCSGSATTVRVSFDKTGSGTLLTLVQDGFDQDETRYGFEKAGIARARPSTSSPHSSPKRIAAEPFAQNKGGECHSPPSD